MKDIAELQRVSSVGMVYSVLRAPDSYGHPGLAGKFHDALAGIFKRVVVLLVRDEGTEKAGQL
jgi:hypothetical protein